MPERIDHPTAGMIWEELQRAPKRCVIRVETDEETFEAEYDWRDAHVSLPVDDAPYISYTVTLRNRDQRGGSAYFLDGGTDSDLTWGYATVEHADRDLGTVRSIEVLELLPTHA